MQQYVNIIVLLPLIFTSFAQNSTEPMKFFVYTLPEAINRHCISQFSKYNWISDMGFEIWPPSRYDFHVNWMFAIEVLHL